MAFCTKCGAPLEEGARFCTNCGNPLAGGIPSNPPRDPQPVPEDPVGPKKKRGTVKIFIIVIVVAAVVGGGVAVANHFGLLSFLPFDVFGGGTTGVAQQGVEDYLVAAGYVDLSFFDTADGDATYELSDYESEVLDDTDVADELIASCKAEDGSYDEYEVVSCSGVIENDFVKTTFKAYVCVGKSGLSRTFLGYEVYEAESEPLAGVGSLDGSALGDYEFSSTVSESTDPAQDDDGLYYTSAAGTLVYEFGFVSDSYTVTQDFSFDPSSDAGWQAVDGTLTIDESSLASTWAIDGATFATTNIIDGDNGISFSLTFDVDDDGTMSVSYSFSSTYTASFDVERSSDTLGDYVFTYNTFGVDGSVEGTVSRGSDNASFTVSFVDEASGVTITVTGTDDNLHADIETSVVIATRDVDGASGYLMATLDFAYSDAA